tara:strand:+ start:219 stop:443 length:225 start_codon:yes stop_codon:yes gene_type:complete
MEKRIIKLPSGGDLEVDFSPKFIIALKKHFNLCDDEEVSDDHIRMFIYGSTKSAVEKVEIEQAHGRIKLQDLTK